MTDLVYSLEAPIDYAPATVISMVPSITESLFDLNLGNRLIGRTDYCVLPIGKVEHVPSIGGTKNPDIERMIELRPQLVFANFEENRREDIEALRNASIPVWVMFPQNIQDTFNLLWNIMYMFDETSMVARVHLIEQVYDRLLSLSEAQEATLPRVFVPIWYDPLMTANRYTYLHDVVFICGGMNVFADRKRRFPLEADLGQIEPLPVDDPRVIGRDTRYPRITLDEVVTTKPDIILLPSEPFAFTQEHVELFMQLDIPAAQNKRIHLVDGTLLTWHGTRVAHAFDLLPSLLRMD